MIPIDIALKAKNLLVEKQALLDSPSSHSNTYRLVKVLVEIEVIKRQYGLRLKETVQRKKAPAPTDAPW